MTFRKIHLWNDFPWNRAILLASITGLATLCLAWILPVWLSPVFNGKEGVRWVAPLLLWMGAVAVIWLMTLPIIVNKFNDIKPALGWGVILFFGGLIVFICIQRMTSGMFPLESSNSAMSIRLAEGGNIYPDVETGKGGPIYGPLYFLITAVFYKILPGYLAYGRIVSLGAVFFTALFVYLTSLKMTDNRVTAIWAAGLFLSTYGILDKIYDSILVDPLVMCLLTVALYHLLSRTSRGDCLSLGFSLLACFAKQTATLPFLFILVFVILEKRRVWVYLPLVLGLIAGLYLLIVTKGNAWFWMVTIPSGHEWRLFPPIEMIVKLFILQVPMWLGVLFSLKEKRDTRLWGLFFAVLSMSCLGTIKTGGWTSSLFAVEPFICILAVSHLRRRPMLLMAQLALGLFNPLGPLYPWEDMRFPENKAIEMAKSSAGEVWLPLESHLAFPAGKNEWHHYIALAVSDLDINKPPPNLLIQAIEKKKFSFILYKERFEPDLLCNFHDSTHNTIKRHYQRRIENGLIVFTPRQDLPE